jgi:hypothetical protein
MSTITSRTFRSALGVDWLVHHVEPQAFSPTLARLQETARDVHGGERRQPWLVFVSPDGTKRRLTPVPPEWTKCSAAELELMCMRAALVPPAPARRNVDRETMRTPARGSAAEKGRERTGGGARSDDDAR